MRYILLKLCLILLLLIVLAESVSHVGPVLSPIAPSSSELRSDNLCPNPIDIQGKNFYPYFPIPNHFTVRRLRWTNSKGGANNNNNNTDNKVPCQFQVQQPLNPTGKKEWVSLVSFERRTSSLVFGERCKDVLELPDISGSGGQGSSSSDMSVTCETEKGRHNNEELNTIKFMTRGLDFNLRSIESGSYFYLAVLFRVRSELGGCYMQVQQYYWRGGVSESTKCTLVLDNICGRFDCKDESEVTNNLKEFDPFSLDSLPIGRKTALFIFLPAILLIIAYRIFGRWIKRRNAQRAASNQAECNTLMAGLYSADESQSFQEPQEFESLQQPQA